MSSRGILCALVTTIVATCEAHQFMPPKCTNSTPGPNDPKNCSLKAPSDPEFSQICHPGPLGHAGGAEVPSGRCGGVNYTDGVFRCACCGAPLFYATTFFHPQGDGWPAFSGNGSVKAAGTDNVCSPGGTEVVCATCGAHLGDFFPKGALGQDYDYYCIDGVCLLPPGSKAGEVCKPTQAPSREAAYKALRMLAKQSNAPILL